MNWDLASLLIPFQYEYMVKAIWISALIGGVCAFLSCFVILKGWSLMGDALSHSVVPGVALAYIWGLPFSLGAFTTGMLASLSMGLVKARTSLREDAVIGIIFTTFFAAGLLLISLFPSQVDLKMIIFGNMLGISDFDIKQVLILSIITLVVLGLKWRDLVLYCFDPGQARALGMNTRFLHFLLLALLSATSVAALQTVGACLVVAMLVTPGATAYLLTDRFGVMLWVAASLGAIGSFVGAYLSYYFNGSVGGCIVVLQTLLFLAAFFLAPRHGLLAQRKMARGNLALAGN
jgi:manganese/iron transport system permease protein